MKRAPLLVATIGVGLCVDQHAPHGQLVTDVGVWLVYLALLRAADSAGRRQLIACLVISALGECFLSLLWGLYDYRLGNVPLFVPPGHALLFLLGTELAPRVPDRLARWLPFAAAPVVLAQAIAGADRLGVGLFALLLLCMRFGPQPKLYAVMFVLALLLELAGTGLGNWAWRASDPWFGLATTNPPLAAGAFYCVLDLLVLGTQRLSARTRPA